MGLLSKASSLELSNKLAFSTFINLHKIKTCALFEYSNNCFKIQNSIGFDYFSLNASKSTKDFWDGICKENNKVYSFTKNDDSIQCLQQFYSSQMNEKIEFIDIYRKEQKILVLINKKISEKKIEDFNNVDSVYLTFNERNFPTLQENQNYFKFQINFLNAVDSFNTQIDIKTALKNEIANRILCYYSEENYSIRINENTVKIFFIEDIKFKEKLFSKHLKLNLKDILENYAKKIDITFLGKTSEKNDLLTFMKAE